jgi:hypothetical protein
VKHGVRIDSRESRNKGKDSSRVFACEEIFYLALLEGLYMLGQALKGNFRPRTESRRDLPAQPQPGEIVIETILYLNAARRTFLELVRRRCKTPPFGSISASVLQTLGNIGMSRLLKGARATQHGGCSCLSYHGSLTVRMSRAI